MNVLPWEIERLGPELKAWLERSLLVDLWQYRVEVEDTRFDWTYVTQEGHACDCRGRMLESLSDIAVRDSEGNLVASGWMDFVNGSSEQDAEPIVFWLFLTIHERDKTKEMKSDAYLPLHVWNRLSDSQKNYVSSTDSKWLRDPKVKEWAHRG